MFCCLTGGKKDQRKDYQELASNPSNKKPEDFLKQPIPLFLNQHLNFTFKKPMVWQAQINLPEPTSKNASSSKLQKKLKQNQEKLIKVLERQSTLQHDLQQKQKEQSQIYLQIAKTQLKIKTIEYMTASETRKIYQYEEKTRLPQ